MDRDRDSIIAECVAGVIAKWQFYVGQVPDDARERLEQAISAELPVLLNESPPTCMAMGTIPPPVKRVARFDWDSTMNENLPVKTVDDMVNEGDERLV